MVEEWSVSVESVEVPVMANLLPVIETVNIFVLLHGPFFGHIGHADFLALIDEGGSGLETKEYGDELGARLTMFGAVYGETADRTRLIVVFQVQCVPSIMVVHESLPLRGDRFELRELPVPPRELALGAVVQIHASTFQCQQVS